MPRYRPVRCHPILTTGLASSARSVDRGPLNQPWSIRPARCRSTGLGTGYGVLVRPRWSGPVAWTVDPSTGTLRCHQSRPVASGPDLMTHRERLLASGCRGRTAGRDLAGLVCRAESAGQRLASFPKSYLCTIPVSPKMALEWDLHHPICPCHKSRGSQNPSKEASHVPS